MAHSFRPMYVYVCLLLTVPLGYILSQAAVLLSCSLNQSPGCLHHCNVRTSHQQEQHQSLLRLNLSPASSPYEELVDHHTSTDELAEGDQQRIDRYPHMKKCKYCKVCVPDRLLSRQRARELLEKLQQQHDAAFGSSASGSDPRSMNEELHLDMTGLELLDQQDLQLLQQLLPRWAADNITAAWGLTADGLMEMVSISRKLAQHLGGQLEINIAPLERDIWGVHGHKQCTVCRGCKQLLEPMPTGQLILGSYFIHEQGASPAHLFRVKDPRTRTGWSVVKVWCVPLMKIGQLDLARCTPSAIIAQIKLLMAQQKITAECGLQDVVPRVWMEQVRGVIPGVGYPIDWQGMWFEVVPGVSLENIALGGNPPVNRSVLLELFTNKVNSTQIKMAAIFDLLFSQCDRNPQNLFIDEHGNIALIDNDQAYGSAWRNCAVDSILIPTTQKFETNRLGYYYVMKFPPEAPPKQRDNAATNPMVLLDYRCHVEGSRIGKRFWPQLRQCLSGLSSMTPEQIFKQYNYPAIDMAVAVHQRARDLLERGFEWTLLNGHPRNPGPVRYKVTKPCCSLDYLQESRIYKCATEEDPDKELPFGDPYGGGEWHGTGNDTGTFNGDTLVQEF